MSESEEDNKKESVYKVASRYDVKRDRKNEKNETENNEKKEENKSPVKDYDNE